MDINKIVNWYKANFATAFVNNSDPNILEIRLNRGGKTEWVTFTRTNYGVRFEDHKGNVANLQDTLEDIRARF